MWQKPLPILLYKPEALSLLLEQYDPYHALGHCHHVAPLPGDRSIAGSGQVKSSFQPTSDSVPSP